MAESSATIVVAPAEDAASTKDAAAPSTTNAVAAYVAAGSASVHHARAPTVPVGSVA